MEEVELFMSEDKEQLIDKDGNVVAVRKEKEGNVYYQEEGEVNALGKKKVCVGWGEKQVCVQWNDKRYCIGYEGVQYCIEYVWED